MTDGNQGWGLPAGTGEVISGTWGEAIMTPSGPASQGQLDVSGWGLPGYEGINWAYEAMRAKEAPGRAAQALQAGLTGVVPTFPTPTMFEFPFTGGINVKEWARNEYGKVATRGIQDPYSAALYSLNFNALNNQHSLAGQYSSWSLPAQLALQNPKAQAIIQQAKDNNCDVVYSHLTDESEARFNVYPTTTTTDRGMVGEWAFNTVTGEIKGVQPGQGAWVSWIPANVPIIRTGDMYEMIDTSKSEHDITNSWLRTPVATERLTNPHGLTDAEIKFLHGMTPEQFSSYYGINVDLKDFKNLQALSEKYIALTPEQRAIYARFEAGELTILDLLNYKVIDEDTFYEIQEQFLGRENVPREFLLTPEELGRMTRDAETEAQDELGKEGYVWYGEEKPDISLEEMPREMPGWQKFLTPTAAEPREEMSFWRKLLTPAEPLGRDVPPAGLWALQKVNEFIFEPIEAIVFHPLWINKASPEYKSAWERAFLTRGVSDQVTSSMSMEELGTLSRNDASIVLRNLTKEYREALPEWGRIGLSILLWFGLPVGVGVVTKIGAVPKLTQKGTVLISKLIQARAQVAKADALYTQKAIPGILQDAIALRARNTLKAAEDAVARAMAKVEEAGGTQLIRKATQEATKEQIKSYNKIKSLLNKQTTKVLSAKELAALEEAQIVHTEASQRLLALITENAPPGSQALIASLGAKAKAGELTKLPTQADLWETLLTPDRLRALEESAAGIPGVGKALKLLDPSLKTAEGLAAKASYVYAVQKAMARMLAWLEMTDILAVKSPFEILRKGSTTGFVKNVVYTGEGERSTHILRVLQDRTHYKFTDAKLAQSYKTVADHPEVKAIAELLNKRLAMFKEAGIDFKLITFPENEFWFHRGVRQVGQMLRPGGRKVDVTQTMPRYFRELDEGLAKGIHYDWDYRQLLYDTMKSSYEMVAEKDFISTIKASGLGTDALPSMLEADITAWGKLIDRLKTISSRLITATEKTIPKRTLTSIKENSGRLEVAIGEGKTLEELRVIAQKEVQSAQKFYELLQAQKAATPKLVGVKGVEELAGWKFTPETAKELVEALKGSKVNPLLRGAAAVNQLLRFSVTGFDLGAPWIHGGPLLFYSPKTWGRGWVAQFQAMTSMEWKAGYVAANKDWVRSAIVRGEMLFDNAEFMEGAMILEKLPVVRQIVRPFERAFTGFLDISRIELWKALYRPAMTDAEALAVGRHIDRLLGSASGVSMGIKPTQSLIETLVFFAPRYMRSNLALMADITRGGLRGQGALRALVSLQAGSHLAYYTLAKLAKPWTGEEPVLDPTDIHYMSFKIGNSWVGMGGFNRSMNMFIAREAVAIYNRDPGRMVYTMGRFFRGRISRLSQMGVDALYGTTYIGDSVIGWDNFIKKELIEGNMPYWAQNMDIFNELVDDTAGGKLTRSFAEFFGLRATPQIPWYDEQIAKDKIAKERHGVDYNTLWTTDPGAAKAISDIASIRELEEKSDEWTHRQGFGWWNHAREWYEYAPQKDKLQDTWNMDIWLTCEDYKKGLITWDIAKDKIAEAGRTFGVGMDKLNVQYPALVAKMAEPKEIPEGASRHYMAYRHYLDFVLNSPELTKADLTGEEYYKVFTPIKDAFIKEWGEKEYMYIREALLTGRDLHPIYIQNVLDKIAIGESGYWDLKRDTEENRQAVLTWRLKRPEVEAMLYVWGYISTLQTDDAAVRAQNKIDDLELPMKTPQPFDRVQKDLLYQRLSGEIDAAYQQMTKAGWRVTSTEVTKFRAERKGYYGQLSIIENLIRQVGTEKQERALIGRYEEALAKYNQFYDLIQAYSKTHSEPALTILLMELERDKIIIEGQISRVSIR